jgi:hypothetical protein
MSLLEFHGRLGSTAMLFALGLGVWGLILFFRKQGPGGSYLGGLVIGEVVFVLQAVLGGVLYFSGFTLANAVHILYGALGVITLPAAYAYTRGATNRREALIYAIVCLFLFGVSLRAISTAH